MATNFFQTKWSNRGTLEKGLILGGSIFGIIVIVKNSKKLIEYIQSKRINDTYESDADKLINKGVTPTYMDSQYMIFANVLFSAMNSYGTDEVAIGKIMYKMKNDLDVNKLITAYGKKDGGTLISWLTKELDTEDKEMYVNAPLRANNIKTQF